MTGPTPKISVRVVPDARTAAVSLFRVSRIWVSIRRRSSRKSAARSWRACATAPDTVTCSRTRAACAAVILLETPPGTSSHSTACRRHTTWVRVRPRSRCRLAHTFSTVAWSSGRTGRQAPERSAAIATERASLGSFLFVSPDASSRTRAPSFGCTSRTRSPAATSCWASRCPRPAAPSTAQVRCGQAAAQPSSRSAWAAEARTRTWPSGSSAAPIATAVCEPLCGSTPIITAATTGSPFPFRCRVTAAGMPYFGSASHLFRATPRQDPKGWHLVNKPDRDCGRQAVREPAHRTSERYDLGRNAYSESAIRRFGDHGLQHLPGHQSRR